jgi:3-hydroxybutyryl-CoA dehydratase
VNTTDLRPRARACFTLDEVSVGQRASLTFTLTRRDIDLFGEVSGDFNPLHFDPEYAATTLFKECIGHGTILQAKVSQLLGLDLPGLGALWGRQQMSFKGPIRVGHAYTVWVEIASKSDRFATYRCGASDDADSVAVMEGDGDIFPIPAKVKAKLVETGALARLLG